MYAYVKVDNVELFTVICLPKGEMSKFPIIIFRTPYVSDALSEEETVEQTEKNFQIYTQNGFAVICQHCRGCGKSTGDFIPYIYEREDGLALQEWVRQQSFYNGEIYLCGNSYLSTVHLVTVPFATDIKGAVLGAQDCERYNGAYRNGFFKMGLHGSWYVDNYKKKSKIKKNFTPDSYKILPLSNFTKTVLGESAEDFDEKLRHPNRTDVFWNTRYGGGEAHEAIKHANIPILLTTGFYDIYTGGIFDMWNGLDEQTKAKSALIVHPYDHNCNGSTQPIQFDNATLKEKFGYYELKWFMAIHNNQKPFVEQGKITYYKLFSDKWCIDNCLSIKNQIQFSLGIGERTYRYDPYNPATFKGGLSTNFSGNAWQDIPNLRDDIISVFTPVFQKDMFVKGKMNVKLFVKSSCYDTCFYVRLSLVKEAGDYGLRDDINQISNFCINYSPNEEMEMDFSFDEHAFVIKKGEKIRIDISSSAYPFYVPHTNQRGLFSEQTTAVVAKNTVNLEKSYITIPVDEE